MIEVDDITLAYGNAIVLREVSVRIASGEMVAIVGPNGAGKSTLLRAVAGVHPARAGSIAIGGRPLREMHPHERARQVALIEVDNTPVENITVSEVVAQGRLAHRPWWQWTGMPQDDAIVADALERAQLLVHADRSIETLSSGERQRAWVALALAQQAPILLFDEPTSHLDLRHSMQILSLLRDLTDEGASVVVVLHDLNLAAAHADRVALLGNGTLLACDVPDLVFREDLLSQAYGAPIAVRHDEGTLLAFTRAPQRRRPQPQQKESNDG